MPSNQMSMENARAIVAPRAAPEDTPMMYGSAMGFWKKPCMAAPATARLAPADRARALFACKEGALVTIEERSGSWLSVRRGRAMGWIPAGSVIELAATE